MNEADVKRKIVKSMTEAGGYARRIEDQFVVGTFDLILIPFGLPVFMTEVKMVRHDSFGPTLRQLVELERIKHVSYGGGHVIPLMVGYRDKIFYFHAPQQTIKCRDCFSVTTSDMSFHDQLVQYYHSTKGVT